MRFTGFAVSLETESRCKTRTDTIDSHTAASVVETLAHVSPRTRVFPRKATKKAKNVSHVRRSFQFHRYGEVLLSDSRIPVNEYIFTIRTVSRDRQCTTDSRECILAARSFKGVRRVRMRASLTPPDLFGGVSGILLSLSLVILWCFLRYAALPNYACTYVHRYWCRYSISFQTMCKMVNWKPSRKDDRKRPCVPSRIEFN